MSSTFSYENCFILKIDYFSENSAALHLLTNDGLRRVVALSYLKKHPYSQHTLYLSRHFIKANSSTKTLYLKDIEPVHFYIIKPHRLFYILYLKDLLEFVLRDHYEVKIYHSYERFLKLLEECEQETYLLYALLSFQFIVLSYVGLGTVSLQMKSFFEKKIVTLREIQLFQEKSVSKSCFIRIQKNIAAQLSDTLGFHRPVGYFQLWTDLL